MDVTETFELAAVHRGAGRLAEAEAVCRDLAARCPDHAGTANLLGEVLIATGRIEEAAAQFVRAAALEPNNVLFQGHLGEAYRRLGRTAEALAALTRAVALRRQSLEPLVNLGQLLQENGKLQGAAACFKLASELRGDAPEVASLRLCALQAQKETAIRECEEALEWDPRLVAAHVRLGLLLTERFQLDEAIASFGRALEVDPSSLSALAGLGNALTLSGRASEAVATFRQALALSPSDRDAHSSLLFASHFAPETTPGQIFEDAVDWNRRHASPLAAAIRPHENDRSPGRPLRIGYVSPDFRDHCQSFFTIPVLRHHDRDKVVVFCYSNVLHPDPVTHQIRDLSDHWCEIQGASDEDVAARIRADRIDVLVDLTMHMDRHRLLVFARRPAPVQVTWLAYPGTTGLAAIDHRVTDPYLDPPESDPGPYTEKPLRLPDTFWCYDPLTSDPPVGPLPARDAGYVRFGCLNNFCKVSSRAMALWARVLHAVPDSRMLILVPEGEPRRRVTAIFEGHGIGGHRLDFAAFSSRPAYLERYRSIDIGLDTLPYGGHTTSLDAFWMGVPVVTLVGERVVGRAGVSQATNLGLAELIATSDDDFVAIAGALARDLERLASLRSGLRDRMMRSPLMDGRRFTKNLEAAYRDAWQRWCAQPAGSLGAQKVVSPGGA
jgi:predicted O-linked N-acetylglucosamine transferase (SPINDLY family)